MKSQHVLWLQTHHGQPILSGLGDHITIQTCGFDAYVQSRTVLRALSEISVGTFHMATIEPDDVDALIADGFEWIVVDPANFSPGLEAKWALHFSFCPSLGNPFDTGCGRLWMEDHQTAPTSRYQ